MKINTIYYSHIRLKDDLGNILPKGGITVAYSINENGDLKFSTAECHIEDLYSKRIGREIAKERIDRKHDVDKTHTNTSSFIIDGEKFRKIIDDTLVNKFFTNKINYQISDIKANIVKHVVRQLVLG